MQLTLVRNREDRPRYVTLIKYEERWVPSPCGEYETRSLIPTRRTHEWVKQGDGYDYFMCTRVTELPWRAIQPQQAHRDLVSQWKEHLATIKAGATPIGVEIVS